MDHCKELYARWVAQPALDDAVRQELAGIADDDAATAAPRKSPPHGAGMRPPYQPSSTSSSASASIGSQRTVACRKSRRNALQKSRQTA